MGHIRVLALHGYFGSAQIMRHQAAALVAAAEQAEFVFVDSPSIASGDFGWWHAGYRGWERTCEWVRELAVQEKFDGILGISQGAALAGLLAATQTSQPTSPFNFKFAVMVGGFTSFMPQHAELFKQKITMPSMHVTGRADPVVPTQDSLLLAERFADPVILTHSGGHVIPSDPVATRRIAEFIAARGLTEPFGDPH